MSETFFLLGGTTPLRKALLLQQLGSINIFQLMQIKSNNQYYCSPLVNISHAVTANGVMYMFTDQLVLLFLGLRVHFGSSAVCTCIETVAWLETRHTSHRPQLFKKPFFPLVFAQWCGNYGSQVGVCLYQISFLTKDGIWRCYFSIRAE